MKELLDTDRVNFLIWRYLLESNYRETAAKLQKEWRIQAPHRHFDFAPHVNPYALVSTLNRGLVLEDYQRQFELQRVAHDVPATAEALQRGVFGPLKYEPAPKDGEEDEEDDDESEPEFEDIEISRKRPIDSRQLHPLSNGSPAKRQRLSNGYENGVVDTATDPMEIDHHVENNHAYPSPLEGEQPASPVPRTEGPEQGTQIEKVAELAPETIFLPLGADDGPETSPGRANENPLVLHCEWHPKDQSILAAAGTDALARIWTVSRATAADHVHGHVNGASRPYINLKEDDVPANSTITAMAWNSDGSLVALATEFGSRARISVWSPDGTHSHQFDGVEAPILKLRWSPPNNNLILTIGPEKGGTIVTIFSSSANSVSYLLSDHDLTDTALDATWISDTEFILCGGDVLMSLRYTPEAIVPGRAFPTHAGESFNHVEFDWRSNLVATSSEKGIIDLWDESGQRQSINAHVGMITSLQWQPLQSDPLDDERLLASGGEDGIISIWNVRNPSKAKYSMMMGDRDSSDPVVALAMTPDGAFIAGATTNRILIWKVGEPAIPRAIWNKPPHPGWLSPKPNGEADDEYQPCLAWDAGGQKLVYGANSRLAVINFR